MGKYQHEIVYSLIVALVMVLVILIAKRAIRRFSFVRSIDVNRRKVIFTLSYIFIYIISGFVLAIIWGLAPRQLALYVSSVLAVLGIGFFATWSLLSNITASVILFYNHPLRIGDRIRVLDKEFDLSGEIVDITSFYLFLKTDEGQFITIPNNLLMQKAIEMLEKKEIPDSKEGEHL